MYTGARISFDSLLQMFAGNADSDPFDADDRLGLEGTLHRICAIRNRDQPRSIIGLTYRIGRHFPGLCFLACPPADLYFHHYFTKWMACVA